MDIAAVSTGMNMANLSTDVSVAMLDNSLELIEDMTAGMLKIMESSVTPHLGQNIDMYV